MKIINPKVKGKFLECGYYFKMSHLIPILKCHLLEVWYALPKKILYVGAQHRRTQGDYRRGGSRTAHKFVGAGLAPAQSFVARHAVPKVGSRKGCPYIFNFLGNS